VGQRSEILKTSNKLLKMKRGSATSTHCTVPLSLALEDHIIQYQKSWCKRVVKIDFGYNVIWWIEQSTKESVRSAKVPQVFSQYHKLEQENKPLIYVNGLFCIYTDVLHRESCILRKMLF